MFNENDIPQHVAIILDGNGRWAKKQNKPVSVGHRKGTETVEKILEYADKIGIKIITIYAFSSENWKRSTQEKNVLFKLLELFFKKKINKIIKKNAKIKIIGNIKKFSPQIQKTLKDAEKKSKNNTKLLIQIALSYGGRDEIIRSIKKCYKDIKTSKLKINSLNEKSFKQYLDTGETPDPDLLIRTGGNERISNFLLYQMAYSEFYFTPILWPDFNEKEFDKAIISFQKRERRFGGRKC